MWIDGLQRNAGQYRQILGTAASLLVNDCSAVRAAERNRLPERRDRLEQREQRLAAGIEELQARVERLNGADWADAGALALRLEGLQQRLGALQGRLLAIRSERERVAGELAILNQYAEAFIGDYTADSTAHQQEAREHLVTVGGGTQPTSIIAAPSRPLGTVGTRGQTILALGMILGGMLDVFSAFVAEFLSTVRRRHQEQEGAGA